MGITIYGNIISNGLNYKIKYLCIHKGSYQQDIWKRYMETLNNILQGINTY